MGTGGPGVLRKKDEPSSWGPAGRQSRRSCIQTTPPPGSGPASRPRPGLPVAPAPQWPRQQPKARPLDSRPPPASCRARSAAASPWRRGGCRPDCRHRREKQKRNLINSFHPQHFPHSIIFKLNNLPRRRRRVPARLGLPGLTKPALGAGRGASPWSPPSMPPFVSALRQPCDRPAAETLARSHGASVGLLSAPGSPGGGTERPGWSENPAKKNSDGGSTGGRGVGGGGTGDGVCGWDGVPLCPSDTFRTSNWASVGFAVSTSSPDPWGIRGWNIKLCEPRHRRRHREWFLLAPPQASVRGTERGHMPCMWNTEDGGSGGSGSRKAESPELDSPS